jgi:hypothetical protein
LETRTSYETIGGFGETMKKGVIILNLKEHTIYLSQYVVLRNKHYKALNSKKVTLKETQKWIEGNLIILIAVKKSTLLGVGIIYLDKQNEVSLFVAEKDKGIGTILMKEILKIAKIKKLRLWGWTKNPIMERLFNKFKFRRVYEINFK